MLHYSSSCCLFHHHAVGIIILVAPLRSSLLHQELHYAKFLRASLLHHDFSLRLLLRWYFHMKITTEIMILDTYPCQSWLSLTRWSLILSSCWDCNDHTTYDPYHLDCFWDTYSYQEYYDHYWHYMSPFTGMPRSSWSILKPTSSLWLCRDSNIYICETEMTSNIILIKLRQCEKE